ncbi:MAG TPA: PrsW family intramembrane metalloprotease [Candidatus Dormibacteraeota bacterium]
MRLDFEALLAGVLPALIWLSIVYTRDRYEREPKGLVAGLFAFSIVPLIVAAAAERALGVRPTAAVVAVALFGALMVGLIEEGAKFGGMWLLVRRNPNLNEPVDGMIYASSIALGFAALETTLYILSTYHRDLLMGAPQQVAAGQAFFVVAPIRAFTGALGHMSFTGITGEAYGRLRTGTGSRTGVFVAYLKAAGLHAAYDGLLGIGLTLFGALALLGALAYYVRLFRRALRDSPFRREQAGWARGGTAAPPA